MSAVPSATGWNMPTASPRVVHTMSTSKGECHVCSVPIASTAKPEADDGVYYTQRSKAKGTKGNEVISVNMHRFGESFVENVSDVRRRAIVDGKAAAPGESLQFLAQVRGWQSEARKQRLDQLLQLNDIDGYIISCNNNKWSTQERYIIGLHDIYYVYHTSNDMIGRPAKWVYTKFIIFLCTKNQMADTRAL